MIERKPVRNRKPELIRGAVRSLNAKGVSQTSLSDISEELGITRTALYYYVEDRQDLVFQCYRDSCERLSGYLAHAVREATTAKSQVHGFIGAAMSATADEMATLAEVGYLNDGQRDTILGLYDGIVAQLGRLIEKGIRDGQFRSCDTTVVAHTLLSIIFWSPISAAWSRSIKTAPRSTNADAVSVLLDEGISTSRYSQAPIHSVSFTGFLPASGGAFDKAYLTHARREALLAAASWLFNRKGVDATSLEEIAARAGATKRAILHHFGDKQRLVEAAYKRGLDLSVYIPEFLGRIDAPASAKLSSAFAALCEASLRPDLALATPRIETQALSRELLSEIEVLSSRLNAHYVDLLSAARAEGDVCEMDVQAFLKVAAGAFQWLGHGIASVRENDAPRISAEISAMLMSGLAIKA